MLKILAFAKTLQSIVLDYVKSQKYGLGLLLYESLMPVLQFLYRDLVRTGLRDHLLGYSHGLSEELSTFSTHLMYYLGECFNIDWLSSLIILKNFEDYKSLIYVFWNFEILKFLKFWNFWKNFRPIFEDFWRLTGSSGFFLHFNLFFRC